MVLAIGVVGLSACKNKKKKQPQHSHAYTQMIANQANLKTAATCEAPAVYYKSCSCGKKGTEAFESGEPLGHEYGTANYVWEENMCTATRTCIHDASHFETETVEGTYVMDTEATCGQPEKGHYKAVFVVIVVFGEVDSASGSVSVGDTLPHTFGDASYAWEGAYCTASRACINDANHVEAETVEGEFILDTWATCEDPDKGHYVATFENENFAEQQTEINSATNGVSLGHTFDEATYVWDGDTCTATRVCMTDISHVETETVIGVYVKDFDANCSEPEKGHYVATFENEGFESQQTDSGSVEVGEATGVHTEDFGDMGNGTHGVCCTTCQAPVGEGQPHTFEDYVCTECGLEVTPSVGLEFKPNVDRKSYNVSGIGSCTDKDIVIPYTHNGLPVTAIGGSAFSETDITSVTILNNITLIDSYAFYKCYSLKYVCFGDGVETIHNNVFYDCTAIESIIFPKNLKTLKSNVFTNCTSLSTVYANDCLTIISLTNMFKGTAWFNNDDNWEDNVLYLKSLSGDSLYLIDSKNLISGEYVVKDKTRIIAAYAFSGWKELTSIVLPDSLMSISYGAFSGCTNLSNVSVGDNIQLINEYGPFDNTALVKNENNYVDGVLYLTSRSGNSKYLIKALTTISGDYEILENTKIIARSAFSKCLNLERVTIPNSVISIGGYAFSECSYLKEVIIPDSVQSIEVNTFSSCTSLKTVVIGNGVKYIENQAFSDCSALSSITFGNSVEIIMSSAFYNCSSIVKLEFPNSLKAIYEKAFETRGVGMLTYIIFGSGIERIDSGAFAQKTTVYVSFTDAETSKHWYKVNYASVKDESVKLTSTILTAGEINTGYLCWYRMPDAYIG